VQRLDELPVRGHFRMRGMAATRIETFTDAAFAFALTLLVLTADIPANYGELIATLRGVPAFLLSATLLMMFWYGHHTWSRRFGLDDGPTILLSSLLVATVLIYVYPLRFLFTAMMDWFTYLLGVPLNPDLPALEVHQVNRLFIVYGAGFVAMCATIVLLNLHAWRLREQLRLNSVERHETQAEIRAWLIVGSAGLLSILIALVTPNTRWGPAGWAYSLLAIVMPLYGRWANRRREAILTGLSTAGGRRQ